MTEDLQNLVSSGSTEIKGIAIQLELQIKELLATLDKTLGDRVNQSFDRLDESQQLLTRNAQQTLAVAQQAADALRRHATDDAQRLIREADIAAYNASYSLPCRDKTPRVLYVTPRNLRVGGAQVFRLDIMGNFLRLGAAAPVVKLDGKPVTVDAIEDDEIGVSLPAETFNKLTVAKSVSVDVEGLVRASSYNLWLVCPTFHPAVKQPIRAQVTVRPNVIHDITVQVLGTVFNEVPGQSKVVAISRHPQSCTASEDASTPACLDDPNERIVTSATEVTAKNCHSYADTPRTPPGDHCAYVNAHVGGCGKNWLSNCKGRGWLDYNVKISGVKTVTSKMSTLTRNQQLVGAFASSKALRFGRTVAIKTSSR